MKLSLPAIFHQLRYSALGQHAIASPNTRTIRLFFLVSLALFFLLLGIIYRGSANARFYRWQSLITTNAEVVNTVAKKVNWPRFAYVQYVTNLVYLCNSLMLFARLQELGCLPARLMMYPQEWQVDPPSGEVASVETRLLRLARDTYNVHLQPIHVLSKQNDNDRTRSPNLKPFSSSLTG